MSLSFKLFGRTKNEIADRPEKDSGDTNTGRKVFKGPMAIVAGAVLIASGYYTLGQVMGGVNSTPLPDHDISEGQSHLVDTMARILNREYKTGWAPSARISPLWTRVDQKAFQHGVHDLLKLLSQKMPSMFTMSGNANSGIQTFNGAMSDLARDYDICTYLSNDDTGYRVNKAASKYAKFNAERAGLDRHSLEPRIDTAGEFVNALIPQYRDLSDRLQAVVDSGEWGMTVREVYFYAQGYLYATHEVAKAFKEDFKSVLEKQSSIIVLDKMIVDTARSLSHNPMPVFNGSGFGWTAGNVQAITGGVNAVHADLKALQDALAAGASRGGYEGPTTPIKTPASAGHLAPRAGQGSK